MSSSFQEPSALERIAGNLPEPRTVRLKLTEPAVREGVTHVLTELMDEGMYFTPKEEIYLQQLAWWGDWCGDRSRTIEATLLPQLALSSFADLLPFVESCELVETQTVPPSEEE